MTTDSLTALLAFADTLGASPDQLRHAADLREDGLPTLREVITRTEADGARTIAGSYPQGRRRVMDGDPNLGDGHALTAYGDLPYTALTLLSTEADVATVHELVGAAQVQRAADRGHPWAADEPRLHGHSAAEQYVAALRAIDRSLVRAGYIGAPRLSELKAPHRPGPSREPSLEPQELRDYARAVLWSSNDPVLDALLWVVARVCALRLTELCTLTLTGTKVERMAITVEGKGRKPREMPVPRPILLLVLRLSAERPGQSSNRLFRTRTGRPVTAGHFEEWSTRVHADCDWARGHPLRMHTLRHTTAQDVETRSGAHSDGTALYLGHNLKSSLGTVAGYLGLRDSRVWTLRCAIAERTFGPLTEWPALPENVILADFLAIPASDG